MRTYGFSTNNTAAFRLRESAVSEFHQKQGHSNRPHLRRLDDHLRDVFARACAAKDFDSATDLFEVLEKWHERRLGKFGRERRISEGEMKVMRVELERRMAPGNNPVTHRGS